MKKVYQVHYRLRHVGDEQRVLYLSDSMQKVIDHVKSEENMRIINERLDGAWWYGETDRDWLITITPAHVHELI